MNNKIAKEDFIMVIESFISYGLLFEEGANTTTEKIVDAVWPVINRLQENGFQIYPEKGLRDFKNAPTNFVPTEPTYTPWQKCPVCEGGGTVPNAIGEGSWAVKTCHCCQGSGVIPMKTN